MKIDYVIIGAGIIGLSIAKELRQQHPKASIIVLEKENQIGLHASGRNSGVLHAGIYYKAGSLKATYCLEGARLMAAYCDDNHLPIHRIGKIIVPGKETDATIVETLHQQALQNGAQVRLMQADELKQLEPDVQMVGDVALFSQETSVVDPKAILSHLLNALTQQNVSVYFNHCCSTINPTTKTVTVGNHHFSYGHLFNTAGLHADTVAKACGLDNQYTMIPFKGMYFELAPASTININHLIYPVPDMNMPFLGIHFTKNIHGNIYIGPTAFPVLGREHYHGLQGIRLKDTWETMTKLGRQYMTNKQGFRHYANQEIPRFITSRFIESARALIPGLQKHDIVKSAKVGIRAQLFDNHKKELVMDFLVRKTKNETHVLNAVSPAFTSAFSFAKFVVREGCHAA